MMPSSVFETMMSSEDSTIAASRSWSNSARRCSVMSRKTRMTPTTWPWSSRIGAALSSIGTSWLSRLMEHRVVREADDPAGGQDLGHRVLDGLPGQLVDDRGRPR